jgi:hypothetical protein
VLDVGGGSAGSELAFVRHCAVRAVFLEDVLEIGLAVLRTYFAIAERVFGGSEIARGGGLEGLRSTLDCGDLRGRGGIGGWILRAGRRRCGVGRSA